MATNRRTENGQAIILMILAMVTLIGFTALSIDGGNAYSDRRHAQNAADTAALAGALVKIKYTQPVDDSIVQAAIWNAVSSRAASNGYNNDGINNTVQAFNPPTSGEYTCAVAPAICHDYIQVVITSNIKTYFALILGVQQITNKVEAVARAKPGVNAPMFGGSAVVALDPGGCHSITYTGSANVTLLGTGLFANSSCSSAFYNSSGSSSTLTTPCLTTVGGYTYSVGKVVIDPPNPNCPRSGAQPYTTGSYTLPGSPVCLGSAQRVGSTLYPGSVSGNFPPSGVTNLAPGVYCVDGNFSLNGGQSLTGIGVLIFMHSGQVKWNGGPTIDLTPPTSGAYKNLLIYLPPVNNSSVTINGNSSSIIQGTILAPSSTVSVQGGGSAGGGIQSQIIGYDVNLEGSSDTTLNYNSDLNYQPPLPPTIELTQ